MTYSQEIAQQVYNEVSNKLDGLKGAYTVEEIDTFIHKWAAHSLYFSGIEVHSDQDAFQLSTELTRILGVLPKADVLRRYAFLLEISNDKFIEAHSVSVD